MGLIMPDLVVVAHSANGMDPEGKTKSSEEPVDECSVAEVEDVFSEEPSSKSKKSILKTANSEPLSNGDRIKRTVSWHDYEGKELHTVREFEPR